MSQKTTSLIEFILEEEKKIPDATGGLTLLLTQIEYAAKIIASHVRKAGLVDILGATGQTNASEDQVQKIDVFSNQVLIDALSSTNQVSEIASEELEESIILGKNKGNYVVFMDPLDGSSNIDVNINVGTIFSIYKKGEEKLQKGEKQVAAGYILYGSSDMFVYTCGASVNGFTLDPSVGSFLLSNPNMKIPKKGNIYSVNEANSNLWEEPLQRYIAQLKENSYKARYVGSMVADVHRTILKGGIFLYPGDKKNPNGKLRLLYEINPLALIIEKAGGTCVSGKTSPLTITPDSYHQRVPVALGSPDNIEEYVQTVS